MYRVITISREFGSGGRTIGREVARQLGIKCYDSELIEKIAEESGLARDYIALVGDVIAGKPAITSPTRASTPRIPIGLPTRLPQAVPTRVCLRRTICGRCSGKSSSTLRKRKAALLWADAPTTYFKTETTV